MINRGEFQLPSFFMTEEELKLVLSKYQQKSFELFNSNIVFETQIEQLKKTIENLQLENEKLLSSKTRKMAKVEEDFN